MMLYVVSEVEDDVIDLFNSGIEQRSLDSFSLVKYGIVKKNIEKGILYEMDIEIVLPQLYYFGLIIYLLAFLLSNKIMGICGIVVFTSYFFYTPIFFYIVYRQGLRRLGFTGKLKMVTASTAARLAGYGTK